MPITLIRFHSCPRNVGSTTDLYAKEKHTKDFREELYPGMYNPKRAQDISISPALDAMPLSRCECQGVNAKVGII